MPVRIQLSCKKGWKMPTNCVKVDRSTPLGNPFTHEDAAYAVKAFRVYLLSAVRYTKFSWNNAEIVDGSFRKIDATMLPALVRLGELKNLVKGWEFFQARGFARPLTLVRMPDMLKLSRAFKTIRGKDLACWCPLGSPCHADVLLEIANAEVV